MAMTGFLITLPKTLLLLVILFGSLQAQTCDVPISLGLADPNIIPDNRIVTSSEAEGNGKDQIRLNCCEGTYGKAWCPDPDDQHPYVEIHLEKPVAIGQIAIQIPTVDETNPQYPVNFMKSFDLVFRLAGISELVPVAKNISAIANNTVSLNVILLYPAVFTDVIRIEPRDSENLPCFRMELYQCQSTSMCPLDYCQNNGTCSGPYTCDCSDTYYGEKCQYSKETIPLTVYKFLQIVDNTITTTSHSLTIHGSVALDSNKVLVLQPGSYLELSDFSQSSCFSDLDACFSGFTITLVFSISKIDTNAMVVLTNGAAEDPRIKGITLLFQQGDLHCYVSTSEKLWTVIRQFTLTEATWYEITISWSLNLGLIVLQDKSLIGSTFNPQLLDTPATRTSVLILGDNEKTSTSVLHVKEIALVTLDWQEYQRTDIVTGTEDQFIDRFWNLSDITQPIVESHNWYLTMIGRPAFGEDGVTLTRVDQHIEITNLGNSCLTDPTLCKDGLTIQISIKFAPIEEDTVIFTTGGEYKNHPGVTLLYRYGQFHAIVSTESLSSFVSVSRNTLLTGDVCNIILSWSQHTTLKLIINQVLVGESPGPIPHPNTTLPYIDKLTIGGGITECVISELHIWHSHVDRLSERGLISCVPCSKPPTTSLPTTWSQTTASAQSTRQITTESTGFTDATTDDTTPYYDYEDECPVGCVPSYICFEERTTPAPEPTASCDLTTQPSSSPVTSAATQQKTSSSTTVANSTTPPPPPSSPPTSVTHSTSRPSSPTTRESATTTSTPVATTKPPCPLPTTCPHLTTGKSSLPPTTVTSSTTPQQPSSSTPKKSTTQNPPISSTTKNSTTQQPPIALTTERSTTQHQQTSSTTQHPQTSTTQHPPTSTTTEKSTTQHPPTLTTTQHPPSSTTEKSTTQHSLTSSTTQQPPSTSTAEKSTSSTTEKATTPKCTSSSTCPTSATSNPSSQPTTPATDSTTPQSSTTGKSTTHLPPSTSTTEKSTTPKCTSSSSCPPSSTSTPSPSPPTTTVTDLTTPQPSSPPTIVRDTTPPQPSSPPTTVRDSTPPQPSSPPTTVRDSTTPQTSSPPTTVINTTTPQTSSPPTTVRDSTTPQTSPPPTTVINTTTPQPSSPPTTVRDTTTPQTSQTVTDSTTQQPPLSSSTTEKPTTPKCTSSSSCPPSSTSTPSPPTTTVTDSTTPQPSSPKTTVTDSTRPQPSSPPTTVRDTATPQTSSPTIVRDTTTPQTSPPSTTVRDTTTPQPSSPPTTVRDTTTPQASPPTIVRDTTPPHTSPPSTTVRDTTPQTSSTPTIVRDTTSPQTSSQPTTVRDTTTPQTSQTVTYSTTQQTPSSSLTTEKPTTPKCTSSSSCPPSSTSTPTPPTTTVTDSTTPQPSSPTTTVTDSTRPQPSSPPTTVRDITTPQTSPPVTTVRDTTPQTSSPPTIVRDTTTPQTSPPTIARDTTTPQTSPPSTTVRDTTPQTSPPSTTVRDTTPQPSSPPSTTVRDTTKQTSPPSTTVRDTTSQTSPPSTIVRDTTPQPSSPPTTVRDTTTPQTSSPPTTVRDTTTPQTSPSPTIVRDTTTPQPSPPSTTVRDTITPQTSPPSTIVRDTTTPQTSSLPTIVRDTTTPQTSPPPTTVRDTTTPQTSPPSTTVRDTTPQTSSPPTIVRDTTTPQTSPPSTTVRDTTTPQTSPQPTVRDTTTPQTSPSTTVRDTTTPQTSSPPTIVRDTTTPQTSQTVTDSTTQQTPSSSSTTEKPTTSKCTSSSSCPPSSTSTPSPPTTTVTDSTPQPSSPPTITVTDSTTPQPSSPPTTVRDITTPQPSSPPTTVRDTTTPQPSSPPTTVRDTTTPQPSSPPTTVRDTTPPQTSQSQTVTDSTTPQPSSPTTLAGSTTPQPTSSTTIKETTSTTVTTKPPCPQPPSSVTLIPEVNSSGQGRLTCSVAVAPEPGIRIKFTWRIDGSTVTWSKEVEAPDRSASISVTEINVSILNKTIICTAEVRYLAPNAEWCWPERSNVVVPSIKCPPVNGTIKVIEGSEEQSLQIQITVPPSLLCRPEDNGQCRVEVTTTITTVSSELKCSVKEIIPQAVLGVSTVGQSGALSCGVAITSANWQNSVTIPIKATIDGVKDGDRNRKLKISVRIIGQITSESSLETCGEIDVIVVDRDEGATCSSVNDPHIKTLDDVRYNNFIVGEFIMYKHRYLEYEVRALYSLCNPKKPKGATCNCGAAVRSGDDVITFDTCNTRQNTITSAGNSVITVDMYKNGNLTPGTRVIRHGCGQKYEVRLPTGTKVIITSSVKPFMNINIQASSYDFESTEGLCGNFNKKGSDDLGGYNVRNPDEFSKQWLRNITIFKGVPAFTTPARPTFCSCQSGQLPVCQPGLDVYICNAGTTSANDITAILVSQAKTPVIFSQVKTLVSQLQSRGRRAVDTTDVQDPAVFDDGTGFTEESSLQYCQDYLQNSPVIQRCLDHLKHDAVNESVHNCAEDLVALNDTQWATSQVDDLIVECIVDAQTNVTTWENNSNEDGPNLPDYITSSLCTQNCSEHGSCLNSICECDNGWTGETCQIGSTTTPTVLPATEACDLMTSSCNSIPVEGINFVSTDKLTCRIRYITIGDKVSVTAEEYTVPASIISMTQLVCPENIASSSISRSSLVAISNDGITYSDNTYIHVVQKSTCQTCTLTDDVNSVSCTWKPGSCVIDNLCYARYETFETNTCYRCDPDVSLNKWTKISDPNCTTAEQEVGQADASTTDNTVIIALGVVCGVLALVTVGVTIAVVRSRMRRSSKLQGLWEGEGNFDIYHRRALPSSADISGQSDAARINVFYNPAMSS